MTYKEIEGDLISLALEGEFDIIAHGCNCQCTMGAGLSPKMAKAFGCDKFPKESAFHKGSINKLGDIDYKLLLLDNNKATVYRPTLFNATELMYKKHLIVVNAYTQFMYGTNHVDGVSKPLDYEALTLCLRKINHIFKGKHIGLPLIGCHLAGGIWDIDLLPESTQDELTYKGRIIASGIKDVKTIIQKELRDMDVTIVNYKLNEKHTLNRKNKRISY